MTRNAKLLARPFQSSDHYDWWWQLILKRISVIKTNHGQRLCSYINIMYVHKYLHKVSVIFPVFIKYEVSCVVLLKIPTHNFTHFRWGGVAIFHANWRTNMTKLIVSFSHGIATTNVYSCCLKQTLCTDGTAWLILHKQNIVHNEEQGASSRNVRYVPGTWKVLLAWQVIAFFCVLTFFQKYINCLHQN